MELLFGAGFGRRSASQLMAFVYDGGVKTPGLFTSHRPPGVTPQPILFVSPTPRRWLANIAYGHVTVATKKWAIDAAVDRP